MKPSPNSKTCGQASQSCRSPLDPSEGRLARRPLIRTRWTAATECDQAPNLRGEPFMTLSRDEKDQFGRHTVRTDNPNSGAQAQSLREFRRGLDLAFRVRHSLRSQHEGRTFVWLSCGFRHRASGTGAQEIVSASCRLCSTRRVGSRLRMRTWRCCRSSHGSTPKSVSKAGEDRRRPPALRSGDRCGTARPSDPRAAVPATGLPRSRARYRAARRGVARSADMRRCAIRSGRAGARASVERAAS